MIEACQMLKRTYEKSACSPRTMDCVRYMTTSETEVCESGDTYEEAKSELQNTINGLCRNAKCEHGQTTMKAYTPWHERLGWFILKMGEGMGQTL